MRRCHAECSGKGRYEKNFFRADNTGIDWSFGRDRSIASNSKEEELCLCEVKKKRITPASDASTLEPSPPLLPGQQEFHHYLRTLAQSAVRTVIEAVMREELDAFIGVAWGECSPKRKGYRNGSYTRDLVTSTGRLEEIKVPRDREGQFHTQTFERYSRYEPHIAEGLTQMFVAGTSTHKVGEVAQTLMGVARSREYDQSPQPNAHPAI